ncbi:hypothetical protein JCM14076_31160 [Methylosoma difficile]
MPCFKRKANAQQMLRKDTIFRVFNEEKTTLLYPLIQGNKHGNIQTRHAKTEINGFNPPQKAIYAIRAAAISVKTATVYLYTSVMK